jgi:hypothetical protein
MPQIGAPLLLPVRDLHYSGTHVPDPALHVLAPEFLAAHGVPASDHLDAVGPGLGDGGLGLGVEFDRADSLLLGDDLKYILSYV